MNIEINKTKLHRGVIGIICDGMFPANSGQFRVSTAREGFPKQEYILEDSHTTYWYPLTNGNGEYDVRVIEVRDNLFRRIREEKIILNMRDPNDVFLQSNVYIPWKSTMKCVVFARGIVQGCTGPDEKLDVIWKYIAENYSYNDKLAERIKEKSLEYEYIPALDNIFSMKKDICFGLTSLFLAMLRCNGVHGKMLHGYINQSFVYHAWSEVLIGGKWQTVDITRDIHHKSRAIRSARDYTVRFVY